MALFRKHADGVLTSVSWERSIDMEHQEWVSRKTEAQPDLEGNDEIRNARQEKEDHWVMAGDEEMERRTRWVWKYEQLEWHSGRTVKASGTSQADVHWPSYELEERERAGERHETYVGVFEVPRGGPGSGKPDRTREGKFDEATWRSLRIGARYHLEVGVLGGVKAVDPALRAETRESRSTRGSRCAELHLAEVHGR
jgi:hypothetical protein